MIAIVLMMSSALALETSQAATSDEILIVLSDSGILVDGSEASTDSSSAVYVGATIVYYESGTDSSYGAGSTSDMHDESEASKHTVITITQGGTYRISGTLSYGQIAIDAGDDTVTLILDGVDITCTVAPAIIFYSVWESGDSSTVTTDISDEAGANIIIADDSVNYVQGSYVAKIYETGTTSKLHKYDGAIYSKMSMIISGETDGTGVLYVTAENEGIDSELHLTINSGNIYVDSQDDGINTNEDGISVTEINGGLLVINGGLGTEGDGIDSNGYLIINGGTIIATAHNGADGGIDADEEIIINGGTVFATGARNDAVSSSSSQAFMELYFSTTQSADSTVLITSTDGTVIYSGEVTRNFTSLTFSSDDLSIGESYYVYVNGTQMKYSGNSTTTGSTTFSLSKNSMTFNGVSASSNSSNVVTISVNGLNYATSFESGSMSISSITLTINGSTLDLSEYGEYLQVTITDNPSESYYSTILYSASGIDGVNAILPTDTGSYILIIELSTESGYTGTYYLEFTITEVSDDDEEDTDDSSDEDTDDTEEDDTSVEPTNNDNDTDWIVLFVVVSVIVVIGIVGVAVHLRKN